MATMTNNERRALAMLRSCSRAPGATVGFSASIVAGLVNRRLAAGKKGGRTVPLNKELRAALVALKGTRKSVEASERIIHSERDIGMSPGAVQVWFHRQYSSLGFAGASSHSGRRTFVTRCAKNVIAAGGSLRTCKSLPAIRRWRPRSGTFKVTRTPAAGGRFVAHHPGAR